MFASAPGVVVGEAAVIGAETAVHANAALYPGVRVGVRCVIHAQAVIGADGFGFTPDESGALQPIAQLGGVVLGDDVVVGAGTTIDRGTLADTVIGDGVKMDNQVQVGHNCEIGAHTVLCGRVGLAGSTRVGRHCVFGGGAGVAGDQPISICDGVRVGTVTTITRSIDRPGVYLGAVAARQRPALEAHRVASRPAGRVRQTAGAARGRGWTPRRSWER